MSGFLDRCRFHLSTIALGVLLSITAGAAGDTALASSPSHVSDELETSRSPLIESATELNDLEPFIDGFIEAQFSAYDLVGVTLSVVQDGTVILAKGYGHADLEKKLLVDPQKTLFRPGSVSKLLTWTAVMQQIERGTLDLDTDVNTYLKNFQIPATFEAPITIRHLLTHTPGFEDGPLVGLFVGSEENLEPLAKTLVEKRPARMWEPGKRISYSNYGTALAGHIVSLVSGKPFDEYIQDEIFTPLGMTYATFIEPLPAPLAPHMSKAYAPGLTTFEEQGFEFLHHFGPAGGLSASADSMARFMMAHLANGELDGQRILQPQSAREMRRQLFSADQNMPGVTYGFWEMPGTNTPVIGHGGDTIYFHSQLILLPERNIGIFISYNTPDGAKAATDFANALRDKYFATPAYEPIDRPEGSSDRIAKVVGNYRPIRRSYTKIDKIASFGAMPVLASKEEGRIDIVGFQRLHMQEVEPFVFKEVNGRTTVVFERDEAGQVTHLHISSLPMIPLEKLSTQDDTSLHMMIIGLMLITSFFTLYNTLSKPREVFAHGTEPALASLTLMLLALTSIVFAFAIATVIVNNLSTLIFGYPPSLRIVLALPVIAIALTVLASVFAVRSWQVPYWTALQRIRYLALAILSFAFIWTLNYWNLIGWKF